MKEKNKITYINKLCFIIFSVIEIVCLVYIIRNKLGIYFSSRPLIYYKFGLITIGFDIIFVLICLDIKRRKIKNENIFKNYKYEINNNAKKIYCALLAIKGIILSLIENEITIYILEVEIFLILGFIIIQFLKKEKEEKTKKIKKFYKQLKSKNKEIKYNIILFEDNLNEINSTFETEYMPNIKISDKNFYIRYKKEWSFILKKFPEKKEELLKHIVVFLKTNKKQDEREILKFREYYKKEGLNLINNYNIFTFEDIEGVKKPEEVENIDSLKICKKSECNQYVEELLKNNKRFFFQIEGRIEYKIEEILKKLFIKKEYWYSDKESIEKEIRNLEWISKKFYDNRLTNVPKIIPKEEDLFELYKNSFVQKSIYQAAFILLNYINCIHQEVTYYIFAKNSEEFDKEKINARIVLDEYDTFALRLNEYTKEEDLIYKNIKEKEYEIDKEFKGLLKLYLSDLINNRVEGDKMTYIGAVEIMSMIRNKIQAHGSIEQKNILLFWRLIYKFTEFFNKVLEIDKFESKKENGKIYFRYNNEETFINLGNYIKLDEENNVFIAKSADSSRKESNDLKPNKIRYVNYLIGKYVKPTEKNLL